MPPRELLTANELRAIELTAELAGLLPKIVGSDAATSVGDMNEAIFYLHGLQRMIGAQAAARAYPTKYRLLGGTLST